MQENAIWAFYSYTDSERTAPVVRDRNLAEIRKPKQLLPSAPQPSETPDLQLLGFLGIIINDFERV